jgi:hypothetical protein
MQKKFDKIAVFDLDGTLYRDNSHLVLLNRYYKTTIFTSFLMKLIGKISSLYQLQILYFFYDRIPLEYINQMIFDVRGKVYDVFIEKKNEGFLPVIISNAPYALVNFAAKKFMVEYWFSVQDEKKSIILNKNFLYNELFVCTDNITDLDVIKLANSHLICCKRKDQALFCDCLENPVFLEEE